MVGLERLLEQYLIDANFENPFDIKQVPLSTQPITATEIKKSSFSTEVTVKKEEKSKVSRQEIYARKFLIFFKFNCN